MCIFHKFDFYLLTAQKGCAIIKAQQENKAMTAVKVVKTEKRKNTMTTFTGIIASQKAIETAEYLSRIYPEQDRLINELIDSVTYGVTDKADALTYIHAAGDIMSELFHAIKEEAFDDRDLSDAEYEHAIDEITEVAVELDSYIDDYMNDLICEFDLYA